MHFITMKLSVIGFVATTLIACNAGRDNVGYNSSVMVDLGSGNAEVASQYKNFQVNCKDSDVVVTSFAGFGGRPDNVSKAGMEAFEKKNALGQVAEDTVPLGNTSGTNETGQSADTKPTTESVESTKESSETAGTGTTPAAGSGLNLQDSGTYEGGATTRQQTIDVDGKPTKICFATLPVNYSSAPLAHKIVQESGAKRVINLGESSNARIEAGANNYIVANNVYDFNGNEISQKSSSSRVVEGYIENGRLVPLGKTATVQSSWDTNEISNATGIEAESRARVENQYFCNALTYVLSNSISSQKIQAYSPTVNLPPLSSDIEQGFLHVDRDAGPEKVESALANILRTSKYRNGN